MIAHLTGQLIQKQPNSVIVETRGGVGYELTVPLSTFYELGDVGSCPHVATLNDGGSQNVEGVAATRIGRATQSSRGGLREGQFGPKH